MSGTAQQNEQIMYRMIEREDELMSFTRLIEDEKILAVDLEADSMYHFKEKICLLQMAAGGVNVVVDPLKITDLSMLAPFFKRKDIKKIFHGADYDVRSLYRDFQIEINNLFDTQIAVRFLGIECTSLESVLFKWFNVSLDKKYQKKDWSRRPLPDDMVEYAARDVVYLADLAEILEKELRGKGRLSWVREECKYLTQVRNSESNGDDPLYLRFKGAGRLQRRELAILESLLQYRKEIAEQRDRPLFKVIGNDSLLKIVREKPVNMRHLENTQALSKKQICIYGRRIVKKVKGSMDLSEKHLPVYPRTRRTAVPREAPGLMRALKIWRDTTAKDLAVDPAIVCPNALMSAIARRNPLDISALEEIEDMKQWRQDAFGEDIVSVLKKADK